MTQTTLKKPSKTKQNIIDDFNHALRILNTSSEDIRLNAIVSRHFLTKSSLECIQTQDIGILHQYYLHLHGQSTSNNLVLNQPQLAAHKQTSNLFAIISGRQCFGGAEVVTNFAELEALSTLKLLQYGVELCDLNLMENALCLKKTVLSEIRSEQSAMTLLQTLAIEAIAKEMHALCILGNSYDLRKLYNAATSSKSFTHSEIFALEDEYNEQSVLHINLRLLH